MESLMTTVEKNYPNLVNCLGNLNTRSRECNRCRFIYPCHLTQQELEDIDFAPGKYRPGFGRWKVSKKYDRYER